ncbi:aminomethyl-transferring glycine dehydrogenase subunit GcvPB [bacterium]|nr:aminomethyl-transferring glycine dehydrogenase subunit GcvPB [bacterium]
MSTHRLEPSIFHISRAGRRGLSIPRSRVPKKPLETMIPKKYLAAKAPELPELSELDVVRHYTHLSTMNYSIDANFYPLGSCTMKYNPKVNEDAAALPPLLSLHPYADPSLAQGVLRVMYELEQYLCEITGFPAFTLLPAAGAHGEFTGILIAHAYHKKNGENRHKVIIPDSAHGTNPASASLAGYEVTTCPSNKEGMMDLSALEKLLDRDVAAVMLTNPNTYGIFERNVMKIAEMVHSVGAVFYGDGANLNAIVGRARPGDLGFDVLHSNLHKTFSTPHGGGGPASGPVGVAAHLVPFLPVPRVMQEGGRFVLKTDFPDSIGRITSFHGQVGIIFRAYAYMRILGREGLRRISDFAVLNANYMKARLLAADAFPCPYPKGTMHEFVLSTARGKDVGAGATSIGKRLLDFGFYAPTVHFPIPECLMIEPTETESKETLDQFVDTLLAIRKEIDELPEMLAEAPYNTPLRRLDEVTAARKPVVCSPCEV